MGRKKKKYIDMVGSFTEPFNCFVLNFKFLLKFAWNYTILSQLCLFTHTSDLVDSCCSALTAVTTDENL